MKNFFTLVFLCVFMEFPILIVQSQEKGDQRSLSGIWLCDEGIAQTILEFVPPDILNVDAYHFDNFSVIRKVSEQYTYKIDGATLSVKTKDNLTREMSFRLDGNKLYINNYWGR